MKNRIKVILVDDHTVVRSGFRMLLSTGDTIEVIAEAERDYGTQIRSKLKVLSVAELAHIAIGLGVMKN